MGSANSNPVQSKADLKALQHIFFRFDTFIQNDGEVQQDYSKYEDMESLNFQTISEHISQSQVLPEAEAPMRAEFLQKRLISAFFLVSMAEFGRNPAPF